MTCCARFEWGDGTHDLDCCIIFKSGREDMTVADRVGLLRADLMTAPFIGIRLYQDGNETRATSQTIHDLKLTIGWVRGLIELYERAVAAGRTEEALAKGAHRIISPIECLVLAWRRGGHRQFQQVRRAQLDAGRGPGA